MPKGRKHTAATKRKMSRSIKRRLAENKARGIGHPRNKAPLPLVEVPLRKKSDGPIPNSIKNAIEFGYVCCEKGMSLGEAINEAFEIILEKVIKA